MSTMYVDIDYKTSASIGKHPCSKCGGDFKLPEGLMVKIVQGPHMATLFVCGGCLEKRVAYQSPAFDITKDRYPKLGLR